MFAGSGIASWSMAAGRPALHARAVCNCAQPAVQPLPSRAECCDTNTHTPPRLCRRSNEEGAGPRGGDNPYVSAEGHALIDIRFCEPCVAVSVSRGGLQAVGMLEPAHASRSFQAKPAWFGLQMLLLPGKAFQSLRSKQGLKLFGPQSQCMPLTTSRSGLSVPAFPKRT